mgnify:CR=1 FL=1
MSEGRTVIVATDGGIIHQMKKRLPGVTFIEGDAVTIQGIEYQYRYRGNGREIWFSQAIPRIRSDANCDPRRVCYGDTVPSSTWSLTWFEALPRDWSISARVFCSLTATSTEPAPA